jgi:hypothetical protein
MDVAMKLNSINPVFRQDHYWPGFAYQEMEARRIQQNNNRIVNNKTRQAIDGRLPQFELLQQSQYGTRSIINEAITNVIPGFIRTGEKYYHEKEAMINAMLQASGLPSLFITLTFNERWVTFLFLHGYYSEYYSAYVPVALPYSKGVPYSHPLALYLALPLY